MLTIICLLFIQKFKMLIISNLISLLLYVFLVIYNNISAYTYQLNCHQFDVKVDKFPIPFTGY